MKVNYFTCDMCGSKINNDKPEYLLLHRIEMVNDDEKYSQIDLCSNCGKKIIGAIRSYMEIYNPSILEKLAKE